MKRNGRILFVALTVSLLGALILGKVFLDSVYRLPILMYHSIKYTSDKNDRTVVSPEAFERQMKFLKSRGYNVVTLDKAVDYLRRKARPPRKTVAITIDDGYEDNYKYAYPILKKYAIPAAIFVIAGRVGDAGFMNWGQIQEMSRSGLIDIESHTMNHKWLTGLSKEELDKELSESKRVLEGKLAGKIKFVCYPMGGYNEAVKRGARGAGYEAGFATKPTRTSPNYDLYEIKRIRISSTADNMFVFWIKLSGYHAFFRVAL